MKYWLSHLPLEVWVDCYRYPWIKREELGRRVDRFGNRKFTEYLQFYLHDWGKRKLNKLHIDENCLYKFVNKNSASYLFMDFPRAPMPGNIKFFERITISNFAAQALNFLRQIRPILTDVNLNLCYISPNYMDNIRTILANLEPLLSTVHSLTCNACALPTVKQCFGNEKFNRIKVLKIAYYNQNEAIMQENINFLMHWLNSPGHEDNAPKLCEANADDDNGISKHGISEQLMAAIRQQFLGAKTPRTFAVNFRSYYIWKFADFHLHNNIGEELHGDRKHGFVQITRHPANCGTELQEWIEANAKKGCGYIEIYNPIGLLDGLDVPEDVEEEGDNDKPSTSKKASTA